MRNAKTPNYNQTTCELVLEKSQYYFFYPKIWCFQKNVLLLGVKNKTIDFVVFLLRSLIKIKSHRTFIGKLIK